MRGISFSLFVLVILLTSHSLTSQNRIDSLHNAINKNRLDTVRVNYYLSLATLYFNLNPDSLLFYSTKALEDSRKLKFKRGEAKALSLMASDYTSSKDLSQSIDFYDQAIAIYNTLGEKSIAYILIRKQGEILVYKGDIISGFNNLNKSNSYFVAIGDSIELANNFYGFGDVFIENNDYINGLKCYVKSYNILVRKKEKKLSADVLFNIATVYFNTKDFARAKSLAEKLIVLYSELDSPGDLASCYNLIAGIYGEQGDFKNSIIFFQKVAVMYEKQGNLSELANTYYNIGHLLTGNSYHKKALTYFLKSKKLFEDCNNPKMLCKTYLSIGKVYYRLSLFKLSEENLSMSMELANKLNNKSLITSVNLAAANLFSLKKDYKNAFNALSMAFNYQDSVAKENSFHQIDDLKIKYETQLKEEENTQLRQRIEIGNLKLERARTLKNSILIGSGLFLILLFVVIRLYKNRYRTRQLLMEQKADREIMESQKRYVDLANLLPQIVFETDIKGKLTFMNKSGLILTKLLETDINSTAYLEELIAETDKSNFEYFFNNVLSGTNVQSLEIQLFNNFGNITPAIIYMTVIRNNSEIIGLRGIIIDITEQKKLERQILRTVIETEDKERKRFSEDLHDGLGPLLSTIKLYIDHLNHSECLDSEDDNMLKQTNDLINVAISETRDIANNLMPVAISRNGLISSIHDFCELINGTNKIKIDFLSENINEKLSDGLETSIYRIVTELINNTLKHAHAQSINMTLKNQNNRIILDYQDDGVGFNPTDIIKKGSGLGFNSIKSRANSFNGDVHIFPVQTKGTKIRVEMNISEN